MYSHWHTLIFSKHMYLNDQVLTSYKKFGKEFECKTNCFCAGINNYTTKGRAQEMHRIIYLPGYNIAMGLYHFFFGFCVIFKETSTGKYFSHH